MKPSLNCVKLEKAPTLLIIFVLLCFVFVLCARQRVELDRYYSGDDEVLPGLFFKATASKGYDRWKVGGRKLYNHSIHSQM